MFILFQKFLVILSYKPTTLSDTAQYFTVRWPLKYNYDISTRAYLFPLILLYHSQRIWNDKIPRNSNNKDRFPNFTIPHTLNITNFQIRWQDRKILQLISINDGLQVSKCRREARLVLPEFLNHFLRPVVRVLVPAVATLHHLG